MGSVKVQFQLVVLALYCISPTPIIPQPKQIWGGRQITLVNLNLKQYFFLLKAALNRDIPHLQVSGDSLLVISLNLDKGLSPGV